MSEPQAQTPQPTTMPRWSLTFLSAIHAAIFGWTAVVVPWQSWTLFATVCAALALLHTATGVLAAARHAWLARAWRVQALASLAFLAYVSWGMLSSAWYLRVVYDGLGEGLAGAVLAVLGLVVMVTLPLAWWGLAMTGGVRWRWGASSAAVTIVTALAITQLAFIQTEARGQTILDEAGIEAMEGSIKSALLPIAAEHTRKRPHSLMNRNPAICPEPPSDAHLTMLVTFYPREHGARRAVNHCLQGPGVENLQTQLARIALSEARKGYVKVDVVVKQHDMPVGADFMASMAIRPGIDGVCKGGTCLAPWQLVSSRVFDGFMPVKAVPSARLGASLARLGRYLGKEASGDMIRIETRGWLLNRSGEVQTTARASARQEVTPQLVRRATLRSQRYIVWSQLDNGRFRYIVNPFTGRTVSEPFSIPRQAGTTLALCEVGDSRTNVTEAINLSLDHLASMEKRFDGESRGVLHRASDDPEGPLVIGGSTLSLAALMRCRPRIGDRHDVFIGRLARMILGQQRPDGGFHHTIEGASGQPMPDKPNKLYIDGQAILGLVLLEAVAGEEEGIFPSRATLRAAVDRGMAFTTGSYWSHFAGQFFYVEENWHCLAAAAALEYHRDDAYERFCLDYLNFKKRFIHDGTTNAAEDFLGGWGFGNLVPPHNTSTAGFGEAMAAAIAIKKKRQMDTTEDEALMKGAMAFLLRTQWQAHDCFACSRRVRVAGGFTEHMASPDIRIDFVQHAWAALSHGSRAIGHEWAQNLPRTQP